MATQSLDDVIAPVSSIAPQEASAAVDGDSADLQHFNAAQVLIDLGAFAGTSPTATIVIEESDDDVTFTTVAGSDLEGGALPAFDGTNDAQLHERAYKGSARYVRVALTAVGGTSPVIPIAALIVRGQPTQAPV